MKACCRTKTARAGGRILALARWLLPGAVLLLLPKCPACFAGYLALGTGLAVSLPVAGALRWGLVLGSVTAFALLVIQRLRRRPLLQKHH